MRALRPLLFSEKQAFYTLNCSEVFTGLHGTRVSYVVDDRGSRWLRAPTGHHCACFREDRVLRMPARVRARLPAPSRMAGANGQGGPRGIGGKVGDLQNW